MIRTLALLSLFASGPDEPERRPNIVVIYCDDLGYGDLGCFGHPTIRTPELDRMAREGQRWTDFYSGAPVCTPSRAALVTGRLPLRTGMCSNKRGVLFPFSKGGLPASELTIAEALKGAGYTTGLIGKWHLGHLPPYLPTRHGFDEYFGIPYSNDMRVEKRGDPKIPLMRGEEIVEQPCDQTTLTRRYTDEAVAFIERNHERPFFLYFAHTFPHVPLYTDERRSPRGLYGDVVEDIDRSVGRVLDALRSSKLAENTLVVFSSDNGPWLTKRLRGGSAGLLRNGKGSTWEGGMRVPTIAWWPGTVPAASVQRGIGSVLDLLPTCAALAGVELPAGLELDGFDLSPALRGESSPRDRVFYYRGAELRAVRRGEWKLHTVTAGFGQKKKLHDPPLLFHLGHDPSERFDVAEQNPEVVAAMLQLIESHRDSFVPGEDQLAK